MLDYPDLPLSLTMESDKTSTTPSDDISSLQRVQPSHGRTSGPKRRSSQWTPEEDEILRQAVQQFKGKSWKRIAECFKDRTDVQCLHRWQKVLDPELVKGSWTKEEDDKLIELVNRYGPKKWSTIAQELAGRIGKQCRERWHNHLNPAINKEPWTQEEELTLIRAHQVYGNKWAELAKVLHGRSDNAIKNHWHSSVKKKLDSYLASGLLAQFPALPNVNHQNQSVPSSSMTLQQNSEDESVHKEGTEAEDSSVKKKLDSYSASGLLGQFSALPNVNHQNQSVPSSSMTLQQNSEDESVHKEGMEAEEVPECSQGSNFAGCSQSTSDLGNTFVHIRENGGMSEESICKKDATSSTAPCCRNYSPVFQDVSCSMLKVPSELADSKFLEHNLSHDWGNSMEEDWQFNRDDIPNISPPEFIQESSGISVHCLTGNDNHDMVATANVGNVVEDPYKPNEMFVSVDGSMMVYPEEGIPQCSPSETGVNGCGQPSYSLFYQSSNYQIPEAGDMVPQNCNALNFDDFEASFHQPFSVPSQFSSEDRSSVFDIVLNQFHNPPLEGPDHMKDSSRIVPVNDIGSTTSNTVQTCLLNENSFVQEEQKDGGALCYDPPRFPSSDVPFFCCDLIQSGSDTQEEYSPFGIRQLMMTSANCLTPLRLWDSPSRDDSPDAILKSAAKTFTGTPSILKKRHRHLLSPLSEKRCEKKLESNLNQESFYNMSTNFSRPDDMFDESANEKASMEDKENLHPSSEDGRKEEGEISGANDATGMVKQHPGVLVELSSNDLFFSPDRFLIKCDRATSLSNKALGRQYARRLEAASNQVTVSSSFETSCLSVVCSPDICGKHRGSVVIATSTALENTAEDSENGFGAETLSIFGETPFKRSFESPSAWKSPWFMSSFPPSTRYDTELEFEDLALFMSPGDRSYDAIGLMKQLSEQTAPSIADAHQILGSETPETNLSKRNSKKPKADENCTLLASNATSERRTLDFNECGIPGKGKETTKFGSNNNSFSSPSSYLLKYCR
ncbi:myb-related protein 3R-1-like isoform X1 [Nicotiana tabacum]|uniref:Myb-related protein 3R-1-like isoform X1 n=2 Tax=Nicotiana tabacum TaxID=4097 RepID=A0A1S4A9H4_TOBAC|nr:PREDICTED: myb-related protein 3R-1-like [Nicotiana tabacum]XP_016473294.1 PREDICTED: myb-related protein 3R-1-like [Nicotiana tabacum]XP_016473295.1 PREDICTED: myb-related protein 3R-1-like [Nicotiana tabacum]